MNPVILTLFGEEHLQQEPKPGKKQVAKTGKPKKEKTAKAPEPKVPLRKKAETNGSSAMLNGWTAGKQYYTIGEVAGLFKVNTSHIRFWTKEFAFRVRTTKKGDRLYTPAQIRELDTIYHLVKERGFTLAGAKARLKEERKAPVETVSLKQSLLDLKQQLSGILKQLD